MKRKKIKLEDIKVKSFVTQMRPDRAGTVKGGDTIGGCPTSTVPTMDCESTPHKTTIDTDGAECLMNGEASMDWDCAI